MIPKDLRNIIIKYKNSMEAWEENRYISQQIQKCLLLDHLKSQMSWFNGVEDTEFYKHFFALIT